MRIQKASNNFLADKNIKQQIQRSDRTAFTANYEYKSISKFRHIFSRLFGETKACLTDDGFFRLADFDRRGNKVFEIKSYLHKKLFTETRFNTSNGVTKPVERSVYDLSQGDAKPVLIDYKKYQNGYPFYNYRLDDAGFFMETHELSSGNRMFSVGINTTEGNINFSDFEQPSKNSRKVKPPKYPDGAIVQVKAKDLDKYRAKVRKRVRNSETNVGLHLFENLGFRSIRAKILKFKDTNWAFLNLRNWGFNYPQPKGTNPDDVINVHILRSRTGMNYFSSSRSNKKFNIDKCSPGAIEKILAKLYTKIDGIEYFSRIDGSRNEMDLFDRIIHGKPKKAKYDSDFQKAAEYLKLISSNSYYDDIMQNLAEKLSLKTVEYIPKDAIERSNAKAIAKAQKRARYEAKMKAKAQQPQASH